MKPVRINIRIGGKLFGMRTWHNVPRVGDRVMLESGAQVTVDAVLWRDLSPSNDLSRIYDCEVFLNTSNAPEGT